MADTTSPQTKSHPSYSFPDADLVLVAGDGMTFHVHSQILKLVSGVFRDMLAIPRDPSEDTANPIPVNESADILATLLDVAYPSFQQARHDLWDAVAESPKAIITAAEKYDMPGVICAIRAQIFHGKSLFQGLTPIKMYGIARTFGWKEEAKIASRQTLGLDLTSPASISELEEIDSRSVLKLLELHRKRKELLFKSIKEIPKGRCCCRKAVHDNYRFDITWRAFLYTVSENMKDPSYAEILVSTVFWDRPDLANLFPNPNLMRSVLCMNKDVFVVNVKQAIAKLPNSVNTPCRQLNVVP